MREQIEMRSSQTVLTPEEHLLAHEAYANPRKLPLLSQRSPSGDYSTLLLRGVDIPRDFGDVESLRERN